MVPEPSAPLRPDERADEYVDFYQRIGEAQLEEQYYTRHGYAVARHHLLLGVLRPYARRHEHLLDVGCASGYYSVRYAARGGRVTGVDVAEASVGLARRRAEAAGLQDRCTFRTGDLRELPFPDETFDVVLATEVLEHIREQSQALAELTRVLRPGGTLVVSSPGVLDNVSTRRRVALRKARTPAEAGVDIEQLGTNTSLEEAGILHEPYFHDAFTLPGLQALLPDSMVPRRLCSLLFVPPRVLSYAFLVVEAVLRRLPGRRSPAPAAGQAGEIVEVPEPYAEASALMAWTRFMWRLPVLREAGVGVLLVGRRR